MQQVLCIYHAIANFQIPFFAGTHWYCLKLTCTCFFMHYEGKVSDSETKQRVTMIHELKEKLKRESDLLKETKKKLRELQDKQRSEKEVPVRAITKTPRVALLLICF